MTARRIPILSIGLPVYNGENYLAEALDCLMDQTFEDFELIINDNASTDATQDICRQAMSKDRRIHYARNETNIGASGNYTKVFERASGRYFRWAAHDDVCESMYHERCIDVLEADPEVSLCYAKTDQMDPGKRVLWNIPSNPDLFDESPHVRLRGCLAGGEVQMIWGVMRREQLATTRLLGNYTAHDRPLVAEMCMRGRLHELDETLYALRDHGERSIRKYGWQDMHHAVAWFDPTRAGKLTFPWWRLLREFVGAVRRSPVAGAERWRCYREIAVCAGRHRRDLGGDLIVSMYHLPLIGEHLSRRRHARRQRVVDEWSGRRAALIEQINACVPNDCGFLFNDGESLDLRCATRGTLVPFPEQDGFYRGHPADEAEAIGALSDAVNGSVRIIVIPWTAFWWFDQYPGFSDALHKVADEISRTDDGVIYRVRVGVNGGTPRSETEFSEVER